MGYEIQFVGRFITDTTIAGEQRRDGAMPSHPNAAQLSERTWMVIFGTRHFTGVDDDSSIIYQLRRGGPDGRVVCEKALARSGGGWDPLGRGDALWKAHGSPCVFGVPRSATSVGENVSHAGCFAAKWYVYPKRVENGRRVKLLDESHRSVDPLARWIRLEWVQFRLNEAEDDIELITPIEMLRQRGYEQGEAFCALGPGVPMNHSMMPPKPMDETCTRWIEVDHFNGMLAAVCYAFDERLGRYVWAETGRPAALEGAVLSEATINRVEDRWVIAARTPVGNGKTAWFATDDPLAGLGEATLMDVPQSFCPRTSHVCADGELRIFSNDTASSPHGEPRNPLFGWRVDSRTFEASDQQVVFDSRAARLSLRIASVDCPKLLATVDGASQLLAFRVITPCKWQAWSDYPPLTREEFDDCGMYLARVRYDGAAGRSHTICMTSRSDG